MDPFITWASLPMQHERAIKEIFHAASKVVVGSGQLTLFWMDHWSDDMPMKSISLSL
jgi:hypothetical protein